MRTLTGGQATTLEGADYRVDVRVWIDDVDMSAWFRAASWSSGTDQPVDELRVTLAREDGTSSIAPLIANNVDLAHEIVLQVATVPLDTTPTGPDFVEVFRGHIDSLEWGGRESRLELVCRDLGGRLQDTFIEEERVYGSNPEDVPDPAMADRLEDVMQDILDDNNTGVTLTVVGDPDAGIYAYTQERQPVMDALQALAQTIGWTVRYEYGADHVSRLTLRRPDRDADTPVWTFGPSDYRDVTRLDMAVEGIRNVVTVEYVDQAGGHASVTVEDEDSIARYGRRALIIVEGSDSPIRTAAQATALAEPALADLKDPEAEQEIETLFFWPTQLGDLYRFTANGIHYDADQDWAVVGYRHHLSRDRHRTWVTVRGKPAGGYLTWLRRSRPPEREEEHPTFVRVTSALSELTQASSGTPIQFPLREIWPTIRLTTEVGAATRALRVVLSPHPNGEDPELEYLREVQPDRTSQWAIRDPATSQAVRIPRDGAEYEVEVTPYAEWDDVFGAPAGHQGATVAVVVRALADPVTVSEQPVDPNWDPGVDGAMWLQVEMEP